MLGAVTDVQPQVRRTFLCMCRSRASPRPPQPLPTSPAMADSSFAPALWGPRLQPPVAQVELGVAAAPWIDEENEHRNQEVDQPRGQPAYGPKSRAPLPPFLIHSRYEELKAAALTHQIQQGTSTFWQKLEGSCIVTYVCHGYRNNCTRNLHMQIIPSFH